MEIHCSPRYVLCWLPVKVCISVSCWVWMFSGSFWHVLSFRAEVELKCPAQRGLLPRSVCVCLCQKGWGGLPSWICSLWPFPVPCRPWLTWCAPTCSPTRCAPASWPCAARSASTPSAGRARPSSAASPCELLSPALGTLPRPALPAHTQLLGGSVLLSPVTARRTWPRVPFPLFEKSCRSREIRALILLGVRGSCVLQPRWDEVWAQQNALENLHGFFTMSFYFYAGISLYAGGSRVH